MREYIFLMSAPDLFDRCHDHQAHALASISLAKSLIETPYDGYDGPAMADVRQALTATLTAYQVLKHEGIFDPAIASGEPVRADRARDMKVACIAAGEEYRRYLTSWSTAEGHDSWAEYRLSTLTLIKHLRTHLASERRALDSFAALDVVPAG